MIFLHAKYRQRSPKNNPQQPSLFLGAVFNSSSQGIELPNWSWLTATILSCCNFSSSHFQIITNLVRLCGMQDVQRVNILYTTQFLVLKGFWREGGRDTGTNPTGSVLVLLYMIQVLLYMLEQTTSLEVNRYVCQLLQNCWTLWIQGPSVLAWLEFEKVCVHMDVLN